MAQHTTATGMLAKFTRSGLLYTTCLVMLAGCRNEAPPPDEDIPVKSSPAAAKICPKCERQYFSGENFCMVDRTRLVDATEADKKVCPVCGEKYPNAKKFCPKDGSELTIATADGVVDAGSDATPTPAKSDTAFTPTPENAGKTDSAPDSAQEVGLVDREHSNSGSESGKKDKVTGSKDTSSVVSGKAGAASGKSANTSLSSSKPSSGSSGISSSTSTKTVASNKTYGEPDAPYISAKTPAPVKPVATPTPAPAKPVATPTPAPVKPVATPTPAPIKPTPTPTNTKSTSGSGTLSASFGGKTSVSEEPTPKPVAMKPSTTTAPTIETKPPGKPGSGDTSSSSPVNVKNLLSDFDKVSERALAGKLGQSEIAALDALGQTEADFTRAHSLLAMNFKGRNDASYSSAMKDILSLPENQYNPVYNLEMAEYYFNAKKYNESLNYTRLAERYKQRIPPGAYFQRVSRIYEVEAKAYEGQFRESENVQFLDKAISTWKRYITHVSSKNETELAAKAEEYVAKLEKIKERMQ